MDIKKEEVTATVTLDELQRRLIAEKLGVSPEEVTLEFLDQILESQIYPSTRFTRGSAFGGYSNSHLRSLTREEFDAIRRQADEYLDRITRAVEAATHK